MAKKRKKLDEFLESRKQQSPEVALEEKTRLSNQLFRIGAGVVVTLLLLTLLGPSTWHSALGLIFIFALLLGVGVALVSKLDPHLFPGPGKFNQFLILVVGSVLIYKLILLEGWAPAINPLPLLGVLLGMAFSQVSAVLVVVAISFYLGFLAPGSDALVGMFPRIDFPLAVAFSLGGVVSVLGVEKIRRQSRPMIVGFMAGLIQAVALLSLRVLTEGVGLADFRDPELLREPGHALLSGLVCGGIATSFLPVIERVLGVVTERRLLELADPGNKLLRVLRERAPGTFQHTLGVQQLARSAAEAIGADVLQTEVGAYYHDIGKIFKPEYFVENMGEDRSIHDRLRPSMSKMIIISHVRDGVNLAHEQRLPQCIIDMIPMHHGTTLVEFFYRKARKQSGDDDTTPTEDVSYRYPGPRPRSAESGILMVADAVEAIAKTIEEPTANRFRDMVRGVIMKRLRDGQFDQCDLTIANLHKIEESFVRTLTNVYHNRINYDLADEEEPSERAVATGSFKAEKATRGEKGDKSERPTEPVRGAKTP